MSSRHWLWCGDMDTGQPYLDISVGPGSSSDGITGVFCIPVSMISTGNSRAQLYGGIYRQPIVRTYADQLATPTKLGDLREFSFSVFVSALSWDEIAWNWSQVHSFLDRAQAGGANPWPRGTGLLLIEQMENASEPTLHDVVSGIFGDVDLGMPGFVRAGGVMQLVVGLYGRRSFPTVIPAGSTLTNGPNGRLFVGDWLGDAQAPCEFVLRDESNPGYVIRQITIGRRWYPQQAPDAFTHCYLTAGGLLTTHNWQLLASQVGAGGAGDTGLFHVYAVVGDSSAITTPPANFTAEQLFGQGNITPGSYSFAVVPKSAAGLWGPSSPVLSVGVADLIASGVVQLPVTILKYFDAEDQQWLFWKNPPHAAGPAGTYAQIDNTSPLAGSYSYHFRAAAGSAIAQAGNEIVLPLIDNLTSKSKIKDVALLLKATSWCEISAASSAAQGGSVQIANPSSAPDVQSRANSGLYPGWGSALGAYDFAITFSDGAGGETLIGPRVTVSNDTTGGTHTGFRWVVNPSLFTPGVAAVNLYMSDAAGGSTLRKTATCTPTGEVTGTAFPNAGSGGPYIGILQLVVAGGQPTPPSINNTNVTASTSGTVAASQSILSFGAQVINVDNISVTQFNGVQLRKTSTPGTFLVVASMGSGTSGVPPFSEKVLGTVILTAGKLYRIEFSYDSSESESQLRTYITDVTDGASPNTVLVAGFVPTAEPFELEINAFAQQRDEEFRVDNIAIGDGYLAGGISGGSAVQFDFLAGLNTSDLVLFGRRSGDDLWYQQDMGLVSTYTLAQWPPPGSTMALGLPQQDPSMGFTQLQVRVSAGQTNMLAAAKPIKRTKVANGALETVYLGTFSLPPGGKPEYGELPNWRIDLYAKGISPDDTDQIVLEQLWLFPADETGHGGITVRAPALTQQAEWHIGTDRWGRPYAYVLDKDTKAYLGTLAPSGGLMLRAGDNILPIMVETSGGNYEDLADGGGNLKYTVGLTGTPRFALSAHPMPVF